MVPVGEDTLRSIAPVTSGARKGSQDAVIRALAKILQDTLERYEINTGLRIAHFLAQICHESDGFVTTEEYASADAYEGRADLGNIAPGDGPRFKGRGFIMVTGRANYAFYGDITGLDLIGDPALAADPAVALTIACAFWQRHELNEAADNDDLTRITRRINGGLGGVDNRRTYLDRAKTALGVPVTAPSGA
jgi:putative chitinase